MGLTTFNRARRIRKQRAAEQAEHEARDREALEQSEKKLVPRGKIRGLVKGH